MAKVKSNQSKIGNRKSGNENPLPGPHAEKTLAVADALHSAAIHLLRRVRKQDVASGEGPARLSALSVLVFGGPKTLGELAAAEQVKPPTMSRIVSGLTRSKLIEVTTDPEDARRMRIRATPRGVQLLQEGRQRRIADLASNLSRLGPEELGKVAEFTEILARVLRQWN
ncbi:MAG TPA: MarR family transcriptional regulator [Candidatus Sulfotelmatobacter sp.]|nr:MarR family transcriptional regulator [Candidatus Sulfotelmatobacter sp.]